MQTAAEYLKAVEARQKAIRKHWLKEADKIVGIYEGDDEKIPFNILYSNTETLLPAVYNSTPRPEVARRYTSIQSKPLDSAVAQVGERSLEYFADSNDGEYQNYDEAVKDAVLAALVPGQGQVRIRYKDDNGYQNICYEGVAYDRFIWAYARLWKYVPWVAFGHDLAKGDFKKQFPKAAASETFKKIDWKSKEEEAHNAEDNRQKDGDGGRKEPTLLVWEIWNSTDRKIKYVCADFKETFVDEEDYPFDLSTRFPCPKPLTFVRRVSNLTPIPPYKLYETQAEELNKITRRINKVVEAIRVRGAYNGQMTELSTILDNSTDNTLTPIENASAMLQDGGGFDKHIWLVPIEMLVKVVKELYVAQAQAKQTIYEIMGIADILRGQSEPSETAKAQQIKNQWGTLRIKRVQKDVQDFCKDVFRISLEYSAHMFTPMTFKQVTQLPYLFMSGKQALQKKIIQAEMMQPPPGQAPPPGMPPDQPPQPPPNPLSPEEQHLMSLPAWEEIIAVMRDRFERTYKIDVETNSTVDLEATEDKAAIGEFMNAFGQMSSGLQPMVEQGILPWPAAKAILQETFRRFRFGRRVEDALDAMQQPQSGGQEDQKARDELHKAQMAKVQADASAQVAGAEKRLLEGQETILEMTSDVAKLEIQLQEAKSQHSELKASAAIERNMIKSDGQAKLQSVQKQADDKLRQGEDKLRDQEVKLQEDKFLHLVEKTKMDLEAAALGSPVTSSSPKAGARESGDGGASKAIVEQLKATAQTNNQILQAIQSQSEALMALAKGLTAPRVTKLVRDPQTGKALESRSSIAADENAA